MAIKLSCSTELGDNRVVGIFCATGPTIVSANPPSVDAASLSSRGFTGKPGQTQVLTEGATTIVAVGVGDEPTADTYRRSAASLVRAAWKLPQLAVVLPDGDASQAIAEGSLLGAYRFNTYKSEGDVPSFDEITLVGGDNAGVQRGRVIANAVSLARDLINAPASDMTPRHLADVATQVATDNGLQITVLDEEAIEREGLGGLRGVSLGSDEPPRLIELTYEPDGGADSTIALVGKGITFDSGGLSLKPADGMMTMKTDMSGAAAVIATMSTLQEIAPHVKVLGIICATENLPGPKATKPGDVLRARNGKTMEVLNTDAEGRLVLADGLSLAVEAGADAIVDVATLTGACMVALGAEIAGLMSNDDAFRSQVQAAADATGEQVWPLPLPKNYRKHIDSEIADMKNTGAARGAAGALTAGLFLQEFVGDTPWAHLDIAGPARADGDDGYIAKGGTGFGVRTLVELVRTYQPA